MVISQIKKDIKGNIKPCQYVNIQCDLCKSIFKMNFWSLSKCSQDIFKFWKCMDCRSKLPARQEYHGKEILTVLKRNKHNKVISSQRIKVKCSKCNNIRETNYWSHKDHLLRALGYSFPHRE